jgi:superfamily II DNA or RNA helicase
MTDIITVSKKNESTLLIDCETSILRELAEKFEFFVQGYKFMPSYKAGVFDGKIRLLNLNFGTLPIGLFNQLSENAKELGYKVKVESNQYGSPNDKDPVTKEEIVKFCKSLKLHSSGNPIEMRDYQIDSMYNCIYNQRQISLTSTGGGKSAIIYCLYRWYLTKDIGKFLIVVPTKGLLTQMKSDFKDYSSHNGFDVDKECQLIGGGFDKTLTDASLVIALWQSIFRLPVQFYNNFGVILGDECHTYKADCCKGCFEQAVKTKYKFGVTGSLDKSETNKLVLTGLIGEVSKVKTTRELIDEGKLSDIKIKCLLLKYNKETKKLFKQTAIENHVSKVDYQDEIAFLCDHSKRNIFIRNLALTQTGVTLILFNRIEHGKHLKDLILSKGTDHEVHYVSGEIDSDEREAIRQACMTSNKNVILLGSSGTLSTGVNLPNINNIIFAAPTKSVIKVVQSIGRGLRKSEGKTHLNLYDIVDVIGTGKTTSNYAYKHFIDRLAIYVQEEFDYRLLEIELEK